MVKAWIEYHWNVFLYLIEVFDFIQTLLQLLGSFKIYNIEQERMWDIVMIRPLLEET